MERIENTEVKDFFMEFVPRELEQCELFTSVFGRRFASERLISNVYKVFTNEYNRNVNGYQCGADNSITLCTDNINSPILTPEELEKDRRKLTTLLHEGIHAILTRTKQECEKFNIEWGTGILECVLTNDNDEIEVGRGLNEGLTNWICGKTGYIPESYEKIYKTQDDMLVYNSNRIYKNIQTHTIPQGVLENGYDYYAVLKVWDVNNLSAVTPEAYFRTNATPTTPTPQTCPLQPPAAG